MVMPRRQNGLERALHCEVVTADTRRVNGGRGRWGPLQREGWRGGGRGWGKGGRRKKRKCGRGGCESLLLFPPPPTGEGGGGDGLHHACTARVKVGLMELGGEVRGRGFAKRLGSFPATAHWHSGVFFFADQNSNIITSLKIQLMLPLLARSG